MSRRGGLRGGRRGGRREGREDDGKEEGEEDEEEEGEEDEEEGGVEGGEEGGEEDDPASKCSFHSEACLPSRSSFFHLNCRSFQKRRWDRNRLCVSQTKGF